MSPADTTGAASGADEVVATVALGEVGAVLAAEAQSGRRKLVLVTGTSEGLGTLRVLADVTEERARQDARWGPAHDDEHTVREWRELRGVYEQQVVQIVRRQEVRGVDVEFDRGDGLPAARRALVKLAALAIAQIEQLDRAHPEARRAEVARA